MIKVPQYYGLKDSNNNLTLECDYTLGDEEKGAVFRWKHNSKVIYQWVFSSKRAYVLVVSQ
jgi:hypothetical protein